MLNNTYILDNNTPSCVYLTIYSGNKMPPYYIGSTITDNVINKNYYGSVSSKKYKTIWSSERKNNPHLFDILILSEHTTRSDAHVEGLRLKILKDVVESPDFINQTFENSKDYCDGSIESILVEDIKFLEPKFKLELLERYTNDKNFNLNTNRDSKIKYIRKDLGFDKLKSGTSLTSKNFYYVRGWDKLGALAQIKIYFDKRDNTQSVYSKDYWIKKD
jgi:hypothetical protein